MSDTGSWQSLTTGTPTRDDVIELDSPLPRSRVRINRDALALLLAGADVPAGFVQGLRQRGLLSDAADHQFGQNIERWQRYGWGLSLAPYLWSRTTDFYDDGPDSDSRRREAIEAMSATSPCPAPPRASSTSPALRAEHDEDMPLGEALHHRRSSGSFTEGTLDARALAALLRMGTAMVRRCRLAVQEQGHEALLLSIGAAFDVFVIVHACEGIEPGSYFYEPERGILGPRRAGQLRDATGEALAHQPNLAHANVTVLLSVDYDRYQWRYRHERALRNLYIEAGRLMQHFIVGAVALGLATGITPAVRDSHFPALLACEAGNWQVLHTLSVAPRTRPR